MIPVLPLFLVSPMPSQRPHRLAVRPPHRLRAVQTIASEQHAHLTCKMNLMKEDDDQKEMLRGLGMEFEQYMKRQSLLQYMVNHPLGITIYGFLIDREFLRSFHMVVVSLTVFLVSMIMGGSHNQSHSST